MTGSERLDLRLHEAHRQSNERALALNEKDARGKQVLTRETTSISTTISFPHRLGSTAGAESLVMEKVELRIHALPSSTDIDGSQ